MGRTSNIYVRIEPEIKEQAEIILNKLGIPMSNAVSIFLRQVVMQNGLPFDVKLQKPVDYANLDAKKFDYEMQKAHQDFENNRYYTMEEIEEYLKRK